MSQRIVNTLHSNRSNVARANKQKKRNCQKVQVIGEALFSLLCIVLVRLLRIYLSWIDLFISQLLSFCDSVLLSVEFRAHNTGERQRD